MFPETEHVIEESKDGSRVSTKRNQFEAQVDTEGRIVANEMKGNFLQLLLCKDDNLLLQVSGFLAQLVMHSKASPSLLYFSKVYPLGLNRKSMLFQKLLEEKEESKASSPTNAKKQKRGSPSHQVPQLAISGEIQDTNV